jgi:hypothetical protein
MTYIDRTISDITDIKAADLWDRDREIKIYTGTEGASLYNQMLLQANTSGLVDWLFEKSLITLDEQTRLREMLWSEDEDNFTVACAIVEQKYKENQKS